MTENLTEDLLIGKWVTDPADTKSLAQYGRVTLEFKERGKLIYTIHEEGKRQILLLTYRIREGLLITNQPSAPREDETPIFLTNDGKLKLLYGSSASTYVRE